MANVKQIKQKTTGTLLDVEDTQARNDIASEVANRTNADNALQEKINTNKNDIGELKSDLGELEDDVKSIYSTTYEQNFRPKGFVIDPNYNLLDNEQFTSYVIDNIVKQAKYKVYVKNISIVSGNKFIRVGLSNFVSSTQNILSQVNTTIEKEEGNITVFTFENYTDFKNAYIFVNTATVEKIEYIDENNPKGKLYDVVESTNERNYTNPFTFEIGAIKDDGTEGDNNLRMRSEFIDVKRGDVLTSNYDMVVMLYDKYHVFKKSTYTIYNSWITKYIFEEDLSIRIVLRKDKSNSKIYSYDIKRANKSLSLDSIFKTTENRNMTSIGKIHALDGFSFIKERNATNILYGYNGKLKKVGKNIVNSRNEVITLTGIGTHCISQYNNLYTHEVFTTLTKYGINCIRISVYLTDNKFNESDNLPALGWLNHRDELKTIINEIIEIGTDVGMYILLDWHSYHAFDGGDVTQYTEQQKEFFSYFSNKYKSNQNILYELHNEPYQNSSTQLLPSVRECVQIIRANNQDAIIICGHGYDGVVAMNNLFNVNNNLDIFISPHLYTGEQTVDSDITPLINQNIPIFVTEWGNSSLSGTDLLNDTEALKMFNICHSNNISYCVWKLTYQNMDTSVIVRDRFKIDNCYEFGGFSRGDLSHNGKLYFDTISKYRGFTD